MNKFAAGATVSFGDVQKIPLNSVQLLRSYASPRHHMTQDVVAPDA